MIKHECWIIGTHIEIAGKSAKMAQTSSVGALIVMSIEFAAMSDLIFRGVKVVRVILSKVVSKSLPAQRVVDSTSRSDRVAEATSVIVCA